MEQLPYPPMPPEVPATSLLRQFAVLHALRAEHTERLNKLGIIDEARMALPASVIKNTRGAFVAPAVCLRPRRVIENGRYTVDPSANEESIQMRITKLEADGSLVSSPYFIVVAYDEDGQLYPQMTKHGCFTDDDAVLVHDIINELHDARDDGLLPNLTDDLTDIVLYES